LGTRNFDRTFALTNELRTKGLDHLLAAAAAAGAGRVIAQSYAGWPNARTGGPVKTEDDPLDPAPPAAMSASLGAIRYLERTVVEGSRAGGAPNQRRAGGAQNQDRMTGLALRYGSLYGPGTYDQIAVMIRKRRLPIVGDGAGVWSFLHIEDAATATVAAVRHGAAGVYNIVDDEPAPVAEWVPAVAAAIGARPPWHVPVWLGRVAGGEVGVSLMTQVRGSSNAKAKRELGWQPRWPSWRDGFRNSAAGAGPVSG